MYIIIYICAHVCVYLCLYICVRVTLCASMSNQPTDYSVRGFQPAVSEVVIILDSHLSRNESFTRILLLRPARLALAFSSRRKYQLIKR